MNESRIPLFYKNVLILKMFFIKFFAEKLDNLLLKYVNNCLKILPLYVFLFFILHFVDVNKF